MQYCFYFSDGAELVTIDDYFTNQNVGDFASVRNANKFWTGMYNLCNQLLHRLGNLLETPRT